MSTFNATIELQWADGTHRFRLPYGQLLELQDKCDAGPKQIYDRLLQGTWRGEDVGETIRLALIGGGMAPMDALTLVVRYVHNRPWAESWPIALAIMMNAVVGVPGDQPGKPAAGRTTAEPAGFQPATPTPPVVQ